MCLTALTMMSFTLVSPMSYMQPLCEIKALDLTHVTNGQILPFPDYIPAPSTR